MFIGNSKEDIDQEISNNTWSISVSNEMNIKLSVKDFKDFFREVISNRSKQIKMSNKGMLFYVWFDWQAAQLRFNLISDYDSKLPFSCEIETIDNLEPVIEEFLSFPYHDGFPVEDIREEDEGVEENNNPLKIFLCKING
ncbi:hypothetical protein H9650_07480 [Psychrobacillus sp. Sa2BUA9]|uniref:Uncharacterized protein n=1 Tax=Psychrobacillus faecigallinarum TaxID=2762235 RepID=A0ABR8R826_9BACI|nr:hypothetical protein [Psychrobacillus faecigallinarum]MBD7943959.1 hypothetical protein [Psychrobacillus faecigallinarum]